MASNGSANGQAQIPAIAIQSDSDAEVRDPNHRVGTNASPLSSSAASSTPPSSSTPSSGPPHSLLTAQQPGKPHGSYSLDVPRAVSPAHSDNGTVTVPPSPTISERSYQPQTTVLLRGNDPASRDGLSSLGLLDAKEAGDNRHMRKGSAATFSSTVGSAEDGTEPDHSNLLVPGSLGRDRSHSAATDADARSGRTSVTISPPSGAGSPPESPVGGAGKLGFGRRHGKDKERKGSKAEGEPKGKGDSKAGDGAAGGESPADSNAGPVQLDAADEANLDMTPFEGAYTPYTLAMLVDPKNLEKLTELGGADGIVRALGSDAKRGLSIAAGAVGGDHAAKQNEMGLSLVRSKSREHDLEKGDGEKKAAVPPSPGNGSASGEDDPNRPRSFGATLDDRHRVYGKNILPGKKSKTLLQLMWIALKDKVLVSCARWAVLLRSFCFSD